MYRIRQREFEGQTVIQKHQQLNKKGEAKLLLFYSRKIWMLFILQQFNFLFQQFDLRLLFLNSIDQNRH